MEFEWDPPKDAQNQLKHGISFAEAALIFEGPVFTWRDTRFDYGEGRSISVGMIGEVVTVVVVHADRVGKIRLISARLANRRERQVYHERIGKTSG